MHTCSLTVSQLEQQSKSQPQPFTHTDAPTASRRALTKSLRAPCCVRCTDCPLVSLTIQQPPPLQMQPESDNPLLMLEALHSFRKLSVF